MNVREANKEVGRFVQVLKETRKSKGVSHETLAGKTGLSRSVISTTESGKSSPTLRTILRICAVLQVKPSDILRQIGW